MILMSSFLSSLPPPHKHNEKVKRRLPCSAGRSNVIGVYQSETTRINTPASLRGDRRCECLDLYNHLVPYKDAWSWQKSMVRRRHLMIDREEEDTKDMAIILQHLPVYTLGTGSLEENLKFDMQNAPFDVYRTERGGEVTYHGPGQIVMYPILNLRHHKMDLHWYLRSLEQVIIQVLSLTFQIEASRLDGFTGVWVGNQKVAAIGIRVSRWITYHGLALNVTADLSPFKHIVPCGIQNKGVGSIKELLAVTPNTRNIEDVALMNIVHEALIKEFSEVFQLSLECKSTFDLDLEER